MKSQLCSLGVGLGLGFVGGLLLMNNCKPARVKVAEAQDAIAKKVSDIKAAAEEKAENKKRESAGEFAADFNAASSDSAKQHSHSAKQRSNSAKQHSHSVNKSGSKSAKPTKSGTKTTGKNTPDAEL